jgi:hypothetical protein
VRFTLLAPIFEGSFEGRLAAACTVAAATTKPQFLSRPPSLLYSRHQTAIPPRRSDLIFQAKVPRF